MKLDFITEPAGQTPMIRWTDAPVDGPGCGGRAAASAVMSSHGADEDAVQHELIRQGARIG